MSIVKSALLAAVLVAAPSFVFAATDCNFDKAIGSCEATIELLRSGGSKHDHSADFLVKSSARSCSAVEFYFETTFQTTFLRGANSKVEKAFSPRPITRRSLSSKPKCTRYERASAGTGN
jgi:hypothetical protein